MINLKNKKFVLGPKRGLTLIEALVALGISAFLVLVLSKITVDFEKVKVSDARSSELVTLSQFLGLAYAPIVKINPAGVPQSSCDKAFAGQKLVLTPTPTPAVTFQVDPLNYLTAYLGVGPASEFLSAQNTAAPSLFGKWRVVAMTLEILDCRGVTGGSCLVNPPPSEQTDFYGNVLVTVESPDPKKNNVLEQKVLRTPVRVLAPAPSLLAGNYEYVLSGCVGGGGGGGASAPVDVATCEALCYNAANPPTTSGTPACWVGPLPPAPGGFCHIAMQVCDAFGDTTVPATGGSCNMVDLLLKYLAGPGGACTVAGNQGAVGIRLQPPAVGGQKLLCQPSASNYTLNLCQNCAVRASRTSPVVAEQLAANDCENDPVAPSTAWINYDASGTRTYTCGSPDPAMNLEFCQGPRSFCTN